MTPTPLPYGLSAAVKLNANRPLPGPLLGAIGLILGVATVALLASPRVVGFSPSGESLHISSLVPVRISFSRPMNPASVESRLSIEPRTPGQIEWAGSVLTFMPLEPWPPGAEVTVRLGAGAASDRILPIWRSYAWTFQVAKPRLAYLWPAGSASRIYATPMDDGSAPPLALTEIGRQVIDFAITPAGEAMVYSALAESGRSEIWMLELTTGEERLVYACPERSRCQALALSPDGTSLAFELIGSQVGEGGRQVSSQREVWLLELDGDEQAIPVGNQDHVARTPRWSPTGLLAFYDATLRAVTLVDPRQGAEPPPVSLIPNGLGLQGGWSRDGTSLVLPEILFPVDERDDPGTGPSDEGRGPDFFSHLFIVNALTASGRDLSGEEAGPIEDTSPVFSPDGKWIAFARKYLDGRWTPGRQLWVMRADGSQATALTDSPDYHHSAFVWSPDSQQIAYMRFNQTDPSQPPAIWVLNLEQRKPRLLVEDGYLPQWIP